MFKLKLYWCWLRFLRLPGISHIMHALFLIRNMTLIIIYAQRLTKTTGRVWYENLDEARMQRLKEIEQQVVELEHDMQKHLAFLETYNRGVRK